MNEIVLEKIFYLGTFPIIIFAIHHFFSHCLECKIKKPGFLVLIYILYYAASSTIYLLPTPAHYSFLLNFILIAALSFFYKKSIAWRVGASIFLMAIILLSDGIAQLVLLMFLAGNDTFIYMISLAFAKILLLALEYVAVQLFTSYGKGQLSYRYWTALFFCPVISCLFLYGLSYQPLTPTTLPIHLSIMVAFVFFNYFVFMVCDNILHKQSVEKQTLLLEQQIVLYTNQYQLAETIQKESLKFRHDLKNILVGLQSELKAGIINGGSPTLENLIQNFNLSKNIIHSGNLVIDSMINYKRQIAEKSKIPFYPDLRLPENITPDTTTISVILGNALDNAIEACLQLEKEKRYIKIQIHYENESLFMRIENPYKHIIRKDFQGRLISTKESSKLHGIGLKSIQEMTERQKGLLNISYQNNVFQIEVVLFHIYENKGDLQNGRKYN